MVETFAGRCQCGQVRYRVTGTSAALFVCHCRECQRQSASAFGMALWVRAAEVTLTRGALKPWTREMPSGARMECSFCPDCGSRVFHRVLGQSEVLSIKPGTLDGAARMRPIGHLWTASKQAWFDIPETTLQYRGNPPDFETLCALWQDPPGGPDARGRDDLGDLQ